MSARTGSIRNLPERYSAASRSVSTPITSMPSTTLASRTFPRGTTIALQPMRRISITIGSIPLTGRTTPESASSPTSACPSRRATGILPTDARSETAMGRSYIAPSFLTSAGARFTVTSYSCFSEKPELPIAVGMRSFASLTAASGRPTMANELVPSDASTSISTSLASTPASVPEKHLANIFPMPPVLTQFPPGRRPARRTPHIISNRTLRYLKANLKIP